MVTLKIDIPDDQIDVLRAAMGDELQLGRPATPAEIKQEAIDRYKRIVEARDYRQARRTAQRSTFEPQ